MTVILTSSPSLEEHGGLNPTNGLVDELRKYLSKPVNVAYIASDPEAEEITSYYADLFKNDFEASGFIAKTFTTVKADNAANAEQIILNADLVVLAGGHVPTQNKFFTEIGLAAILKKYNGVVLGNSAGSMNSADSVYCAPELEGEAINPAFKRELKGLGLTDINIMPHFNYTCGAILDGLFFYRDIVLKDSLVLKKKIYVIPDGTFFINDKLYGPAYIFENGKITAV